MFHQVTPGAERRKFFLFRSSHITVAKLGRTAPIQAAYQTSLSQFRAQLAPPSNKWGKNQSVD